MLKSIIDKVGKLFEGRFSWKRVHSPNFMTKVKTHQRNAINQTGDGSHFHIGDVHNYPAKKETRETTSYRSAWKKLLDTFSPLCAQRLVLMINNPKNSKKDNLEGHKKWLAAQFENIGLDHSDSRATIFNQIQEKASASIEELYANGDEGQFKEDWADYSSELERIKDI